ncbi:MAG: TadE/TadG family type IV pilus assembly protein [Lapillicoccus sp.]
MSIRKQSWRRRDAGASAVELAIVLPVLALLAFGIIDFGRMLNAQIQLSQAAREGVRLAALAGGSGYSAADVSARVAQAAPNPGFGGTAASVSPAPVLCAATAAPTDAATVDVAYQFRGIFFLAGGIALQQKAVMRCGG